MRSLFKRAAFVLLSAAILLGTARLIPTRIPPAESPPEVYVYDGYAVTTLAAYDADALEYAARKFQQLYDRYLTANAGHIYLSVVPDKGSFTQPPAWYTPASAEETAHALLASLDFTQYVDIAPLLALPDYYRTDLHWRQECLTPVAQALAQAMDVPLAGTYRQQTLDIPFHGTYWDKAGEPLTADTLSYLTSDVLDACTVWNYETDSACGLYDLDAAQTDTPYDLFLAGSRSLLRIESPLSSTQRQLVVFRDSFASSLIPLLAESYRTITLVDIRYLAGDLLGRFVTFSGDEDVLFLYSTAVLNNSKTLR